LHGALPISAEAVGELRQQARRAAVEHVRDEQVVPRTQHAEQRRRDRRHPGRSGHGRLALLQLGELVGQVLLRRRRAHPHVLDLVVGLARAGLKHRSLVDREHQRAFRPRPAFPRVHRCRVDGWLLHHAAETTGTMAGVPRDGTLPTRADQPATISPESLTVTVRFGNGSRAGPLATLPSSLNFEPWHLQLIVPSLTLSSTQPWLVQIAENAWSPPPLGCANPGSG